jgi:excisionase family DNA binding protein
MAPRFLQLADVSEILNISLVQARAMVISGELPAIQVGGRGQWRIEASELESYIERKYAETRARVNARGAESNLTTQTTEVEAGN